MRAGEFRWSQIRVGLFIALCGVVLFAAVFYFGISGSPLSNYAHVHAEFDNVFGLAEGSPVEMGGVVVGQIESISLPDLRTGLVPVTLSIKRGALDRLGPSSVAFASSHALVGQRFIGLTTRRENEPPLRNGGDIKTRPSQAMDALIEQATKTLTQVSGMVNDARRATAALAQVATALSEGQGTLGRLIRDDALYDSLAGAAGNARTFTNRMVHGDGLLPALVNSHRLAEDVDGSAADAHATLERLREGQGILGRLTTNGPDAERIDRVLANLDLVTTRLAEARGTLGGLIRDPTLLRQMNTLVARIDALIADVRRNPQRYLNIKAF